MKITKVFYSALVNLGDYQNERIGMVALLAAGDDPDEIVKQLRTRVIPLCGTKFQQLDNERYRLAQHIRDLERKLADYQKQWDAAAEFLRAQGIKPDAPNFPQFTNLLPAVSEESGLIEAEYEDDDDHDDDDIEL